MIKMDNGALLALGLVGVMAAAGRMKRGSFSESALLQQIEQIYEASDSDQEVDSNELTYVLYNASESREVPAPLRHEADELLARSEEEQYIDTGEALELLGRIRDAMRNVAQKKHAARKGGSRAVGVHANSASGRVRAAIPSAYISRVAFERGVGGGTCVYSGNLKQHEWDAVISALRHEGFAVHGAMVYGMPAVCATKPKADPRKGGSRAVGVNANSAKSRAEYVKHLDDLTARAKAGELNFDENARWSFGADPTPYDPPNVNRKLITQAILKNIATERAWISTWPQRNPGAGSKAVYGMSPTDAGHVLRVGGAQPKIRSNAGEALNDYRWHPDRALAELEAARGKGKGGSRAKHKPVQGTVGGGMVFLPPSTPGGPPRFGLAARGGEHRGPPRLNPYTGQFKQGQIVKGGSRSYGTVSELSVMDPVSGRKKRLSRHTGESGDEFMGRAWVEIEEWLTGKRLGTPAAGVEVLLWSNYGGRIGRHPSKHVAYERYVATGNAYKDRWKRAGFGPGSEGGSRARKIHDDREYTHYVVHGPTMKILSGWSFPEDAREEIKENLGTAGKDCKVYTRRHLTRSGLEPRENTNWGGAALHQSLFRA